MKISWNKSYTYYDAPIKEFKTRTLNFFQRILRVLGAYSYTRLARVTEIAKSKIFDTEVKHSGKSFKLIAKGISRKKISRESIIGYSDQATFYVRFNPTGNRGASFMVELNHNKRQAGFHLTLDGRSRIKDRLIAHSLYGLDHKELHIFSDEKAQQDPLVLETYELMRNLLWNSQKISAIVLKDHCIETAPRYGFKKVASVANNDLFLSRNDVHHGSRGISASLDAFLTER